MNRCLVVFVSCFASLPALAAAQSIAYFKFTPAVIPASQTQAVLYEAEVSGQPSRVSFEFQPGATGPISVLDLRNDGTAGDRQAGDNVWSVQLPIAPILTARRADDVQRVFVGFIDLFNGPTRIFRGNMFVQILTPDLSTRPITRLSQFVQATSRVVNIHDAGYFVSNDLTRVTREFYRWFGDDYDFLNLIYEPARFLNRTHFQAKNEVEGIGVSLFNNTSFYGSAGRLLGISQFPIGSFFDGAETGHIHEIGHQWINFLDFAPLASSRPHWPLSSMAGGVMGFSLGGQGGSFPCIVTDQNGIVVLTRRSDAPVFGSLDLYLMGLLPAAGVSTQVVFANQSSDSALIAQCTGQTYTGAVTRVTVQDVIARYGPRRPDTASAQTRFRVATILVTREGLASQEELSLYSHFAERGELRAPTPTHAGFAKETGQPFYVATGSRATLDMTIGPGQAEFTLVPTPASRTVAAGSPATFSIHAAPRPVTFDGAVSFSCEGLPANASCSFAPTEVVPGSAGRDVTLTIATRAGQTAYQSGVGFSVVASAGVWLAVALAAGRPRRSSHRRAHWSILIGAFLVLAACDKTPPPSQPPPAPTTAPGTYTVTVTGTSGAMQQSTAVTLTVQ